MRIMLKLDNLKLDWLGMPLPNIIFIKITDNADKWGIRSYWIVFISRYGLGMGNRLSSDFLRNVGLKGDKSLIEIDREEK